MFFFQDNSKWSFRMDEQLMSWATTRPEVTAGSDEITQKNPTYVSLFVIVHIPCCTSQDWQEGGKSEVYLWGNGRYGQLAGIGTGLMMPTLVPSLSQTQQVTGLCIRTHTSSFISVDFITFFYFRVCVFYVVQVVCGQNCTFLVQSNGTVLAVGEGQYGRLGQGNSDDLYVPTIIFAFQGKNIHQQLKNMLEVDLFFVFSISLFPDNYLYTG